MSFFNFYDLLYNKNRLETNKIGNLKELDL